MLVRVGRINFDAFLDVSKQLLIWGLSRKRDIHTTCGNYYFDRNRNFNDRSRRFSEEDYEDDFESRPRNFRYNDRGNFRNQYGAYQRGFRNRPRRWNLEENQLGESPKTYDLESLVKHEKNLYQPHPNVLSRSEEEIKSFYEQNEIQIFGDMECLPPILSFEELNLDEKKMEIIRNLNYSKPSPIQSMTWPVALSGMNMVGVAQTGSGKTLGFTLPGLIHAKSQPVMNYNEGPIVLVIAPTRELAQQTEKVMNIFAPSFNLKTACVFGGSSMFNQMNKLRMAEVCVGTPGRLLDFLKQGVVNLSRCSYFVLDEADRLLDMGFEPQIRSIMKQTRPDSQILMWSATWPSEVEKLASKHLKTYVGVKFGSSKLTINRNITQYFHVCDYSERDKRLEELLKEMEGQKILMFCQTRVGADSLKRKLRNYGFNAEVLHGQLSQKARDRTLQKFRNGYINILVGTAVVSRGLDIDDIKCVINYDPPVPIEDYVHVIGRTGRCGKTGIAHTFFTTDISDSVVRDYTHLLRQNDVQLGSELTELEEELRNQRFSSRRKRPSRMSGNNDW